MSFQSDNRRCDRDKHDSALLDIGPSRSPSVPPQISNVIPIHGGPTPEMKTKVWEPPKEVLWLGNPMAILAMMINPSSYTIGHLAKVAPQLADQAVGIDEWAPPNEVIWLGHQTDVLALCQELEARLAATRGASSCACFVIF